MAGFITTLDLIWNFIFSVLDRLVAVVLASPILTAAIALWILDKVFGIFDLIKG